MPFKPPSKKESQLLFIGSPPHPYKKLYTGLSNDQLIDYGLRPTTANGGLTPSNVHIAFQFEMEMKKIQLNRKKTEREEKLHLHGMNYFRSEHSTQAAILVKLFYALASK